MLISISGIANAKRKYSCSELIWRNFWSNVPFFGVGWWRGGGDLTSVVSVSFQLCALIDMVGVCFVGNNTIHNCSTHHVLFSFWKWVAYTVMSRHKIPPREKVSRKNSAECAHYIPRKSAPHHYIYAHIPYPMKRNNHNHDSDIFITNSLKN